MVLTPQLVSNPTGWLMQFFYLRPNHLVRNDRAAIIQAYHKIITITNANIVAGDTINFIYNVQTPTPTVLEFTAVSGAPTTDYEFQIQATGALTAAALANTINNLALTGISASNSLATVDISYDQISAYLETTNETAFGFDNTILTIEFDQLPSTWTDPDTDQTSDLYTTGCLVDFLQTNPGHKIYTYDVTLLSIVGTRGTFDVSELQNYMSNSNGGTLEFYPIKIGDYICLQNECIIPGIPPELHHALAERAASRVMMAIGDKEGYAISSAKIAEMDKKQSTLIGSRVESSVPKVFNRYSLLRLGKSRFRRRY